jgi:hypothetical protein
LNASHVPQPFVFACRLLATPQTEQEKQFSKFQTWIQQKFNIPSSQSWDKVILFFSQDEHTALEQFFKVFNEFVPADPADPD